MQIELCIPPPKRVSCKYSSNMKTVFHVQLTDLFDIWKLKDFLHLPRKSYLKKKYRGMIPYCINWHADEFMQWWYCSSFIYTRATFETSKYPRRPPPKKKKILVINLVEKKMVALWNSWTMKQSSDLKTSSIPLRCLEAQLSSLSLVSVLLILFVCRKHSRQYSWFSRISSTVANRYRKPTSLLKHSVSITAY